MGPKSEQNLTSNFVAAQSQIAPAAIVARHYHAFRPTQIGKEPLSSSGLYSFSTGTTGEDNKKRTKD